MTQDSNCKQDLRLSINFKELDDGRIQINQMFADYKGDPYVVHHIVEKQVIINLANILGDDELTPEAKEIMARLICPEIH